MKHESSNQFLTPHFELREFVASRTARDHGINNTPPEEAVENLRALCEHTLEPLREALGLPIVVTSGYRCKALNHLLVNHSVKSQHMNGQAADFYVGEGPVSSSKVLGRAKRQSRAQGSSVQSASRRELLIKAFRLIITSEQIDYDQLILYPSFIHVSYVSRERNRRKLTRAFSNGIYDALTRAEALTLE